jgi:hypothetical protein
MLRSTGLLVLLAIVPVTGEPGCTSCKDWRQRRDMPEPPRPTGDPPPPPIMREEAMPTTDACGHDGDAVCEVCEPMMPGELPGELNSYSMGRGPIPCEGCGRVEAQNLGERQSFGCYAGVWCDPCWPTSGFRDATDPAARFDSADAGERLEPEET